MGVDSGVVANWAANAGLISPQPGIMPWEGMAASWQTPQTDSLYGGPSQLTAPTIKQYPLAVGSTALVWWDKFYGQSTPITLMPFNDSVAAAVIAGDLNLGTMGTTRVNLTTDPSFEDGSSTRDPNVYNGATRANITDATTFAGTHLMRITGGTAGGLVSLVAQPSTHGNVSAGNTYIVSFYIRTLTGSSVGKVITSNIQYYNSGSGIGGGSSTTVTLSNAWQRIVCPAKLAPATANEIGGWIGTPAGWLSTDTFDIDGVLVEQSSSAGTYFDGTTSGASWNGTVNNSMSTLAAPGALTSLVAGQTYTVSTAVWSPGNVPGVNLARYRLVTNTVQGVAGATTTYSPAITNDGRLSWSFTVPANTVAAYLAVEAMGTTPAYTTWFSKPTIHALTNDSSILWQSNAVPLRTLQVRMPPNYQKAGWPTGAVYLQDAGAVTTYTWHSQNQPLPIATPVDGLPLQGVTTGSSGASNVALVQPVTVGTAADMRFISGYNYVNSGGNWTWSPYAQSVTSSVSTFQLQGIKAPPVIPVTDAQAFRYQLNSKITLTIPTMRFVGRHGLYLYSDQLDGLNITEYTVLMVLKTSVHAGDSGGLWSSGVKAAGGGVDTSASLTAFNYRSVGLNGPLLTLESQGAQHQNFSLDKMAQVNHPTYLAMQFRNDYNRIIYADAPNHIQARSFALGSTATGGMNGTVILGADATYGLRSGTFDLFEINMYFRPMSLTAIYNEIKTLGRIYG